MPPNARARARDKKRLDRRQIVLDLREAEARRKKRVVAIAMAVGLVVTIGVVGGLSLALRGDDKTKASSTTKPLVAGCVVAPKTPTDSRKGTLPDKKTAAGKTFVATVTTSCGDITMELDGTKAPQTVASFLGLAKSGYWADSPCHRLTTSGIFVLQCGDPTGTGNGDPGYGFGVENAPADSIFAPGILAMARTPDPKTNGGQFFIVYRKTVLPDPAGYSIFGKVTSGMDIVNKIAAAGATPAEVPKQPISILTVKVAEKKASQ